MSNSDNKGPTLIVVDRFDSEGFETFERFGQDGLVYVLLLQPTGFTQIPRTAGIEIMLPGDVVPPRDWKEINAELEQHMVRTVHDFLAAEFRELIDNWLNFLISEISERYYICNAVRAAAARTRARRVFLRVRDDGLVACLTGTGSSVPVTTLDGHSSK